MKGIQVPKAKDFLKADGSHFVIIKKNDKGEPVYKMNKDMMIGEIIVVEGKNVFLPTAERESAGWLDVLKEAMGNIQNTILREKNEKKELPGLSWDDAGNAVGVFRGISVAHDDTLELEDSEYKWLTDNLKKYGPGIYGFDAFIIGEPLEHPDDLGTKRAERRREDKGKKA